MSDSFSSSNELLNDPPRLRERLAEDGYLFFRGLGPREKILAARRDVLKLCENSGWVKRGSDGQWSGAGPFTEGDAEYMAVYKNIIKLPTFLAVPEDSRFLDLIGIIVEGPPMLHRLRIGRVTFPNNEAQTTAAHQDWMYIRGTPATYTIWLPLGDCPRELGGLAVLRSSHRGGFIEHVNHPEKKYAGMGLDEPQLPSGDWLTSDFSVGDFLLFHSHTVHKALPNRSGTRLRLSMDNRYQREGDEIAPISLKTHYNL